MEALFHHYCIAWSPSALLEEPDCLPHAGQYIRAKRAPFSAQSAFNAGPGLDRHRSLGLSKILKDAGMRGREQSTDVRYWGD